MTKQNKLKLNKQRKASKKFQGKELYLLKQLYHNTKQAKVKDKCRVIILRAKGYAIKEVAGILDLSPETVKDWSKLFLKKGAQAFEPKQRISNHKYLAENQKQQLKNDLNSSPKQLGLQQEFWTLTLLKEYVKKNFKIVYKSNQSYYDLFKYAGLTCQKPRPKNKRQDEKQIKKFMKHTEVLLKKGGKKITLSW